MDDTDEGMKRAVDKVMTWVSAIGGHAIQEYRIGVQSQVEKLHREATALIESISLDLHAAELAALRTEIDAEKLQASAKINIQADSIRRLEASLAALRAERDAARKVINQCRLAFAGYVSAQSAVDMIDALSTPTEGTAT